MVNDSIQAEETETTALLMSSSVSHNESDQLQKRTGN